MVPEANLVNASTIVNFFSTGKFQVRYDSAVVIYDCRAFVRWVIVCRLFVTSNVSIVSNLSGVSRVPNKGNVCDLSNVVKK